MQISLARSLVVSALIVLCPINDTEAQLFKKKQPKQQAAAAAPKLAPGQFEW